MKLQSAHVSAQDPGNTGKLVDNAVDQHETHGGECVDWDFRS